MNEDKKNNNEEHRHSKRPIDEVSEETYSWWKKNYVLIKKNKIKTWQGVFVLAFIVGAAVALIWTISVNVHQFLKAEGETATLKLSAGSQAVLVGESFEVDVTVDAGSNKVVAARAIVNYNPDDLELVDCNTAESAFFVSTESCLATRAESFRIVNNETSGVFDITMAKPTPGVTGNGRMVATLVFKALRITSSPTNIQLSYNSQTGGNYADSDVILDNREGTDILIGVNNVSMAISAAACDDWDYSDWGSCQPGNMFDGFDGFRTRIITEYIPAGCAGEPNDNELSEGCDYPETIVGLCEVNSYQYSGWGSCQVTNIKTRTILASAPDGCDRSNAETIASCIYVDPGDGNPIGGEDVEVEDPKIRVGKGDRVKLKKDKKFYSKEEKFSFKGKIDSLAGGIVNAYVDGDLDEEIKLGSDGEWSFSKKGKNGKTYEIKFVYYNSSGQEVDSSGKYEIKVDTKKPKFTDLPLALNKYPGSKVWWIVEDNHKLDSFKVEFNGKEKEMKDPSFVIPANTPKGMHWMVVKAYDKAGNKEIRRVLIRIR